MKIKDGFMLRTVSGQTVVLPVAGDLDLNMMITLNETAAFLWKHIENGADEDELVSALLSEYEITEEDARKHIKKFGETLNEHGFLE